MRKFNLQTVFGVIVMVSVAVLPLETSADICFTGGTGETAGTFDIDIAASNEQFHSLIGEFVTTTGRTPIVGTARIRPDGVAEIGGIVPANPQQGLTDAFTFSGTLNPPSFNTGTAVFQSLTAQEPTTQAFFGPTACPPQ
jgi:hypothetical protein